MDLDGLRFAVAIADTGSIQSAARKLPASRATVRRRLKEIEDEVGAPLFQRTAKGLIPTAAGDTIVERGREMVAETAVLVRTAASLGKSPRGALRGALPPGSPPALIELVLRALRQNFPDLLLDLTITEGPLASLLDRVDIVVTLDDAPAPSSWEDVRLGHIPERLLASREYLASHAPIERPADLRGHDLLVWQPPQSPRPDRLPKHSGGAVVVTPKVVSSDIHLLHHMALAGCGIAFAPDAELPAFLGPPGEAVRVLEGVIGRMRTIRLLCPKALRHWPHVSDILENVRRLVPLR